MAMSAKARKYSTLIAGFLCFLPLDFGIIWGNMSVYIYSYLWKEHNITSGFDMPWVVSFFVIGFNVSCYFCGYLDNINPRLGTLVGIILLNSGFFGIYFFLTMAGGLDTFIVTGLFVGLGTGLISCSIYKSVAVWANSDNAAFMVFVVYSSSSIGNSLFNPLVTWIVNPDNISPSVQVGEHLLITDQRVVDRVPYMALILGATISTLQLIGLGMIRGKEPEKKKPIIELNNVSYGTHSTSAGTSTIPDSDGGDEDGVNVSVNSEGQEQDRKEVKMKKSCMEKATLLSNAIFNSPTFLCLWLSYAATEYSYFFVSNYYKQFGQIYIKDDHFLTNIAVAIGVSAFMFRLVWGRVIDKIGIKICLVIALAVDTAIPTVIYFMPRLSKYLYLITVTIMYSFRCIMKPTSMVSAEVYFGKERVSTFFGLITSGSILSNLTAPPVFSYLLSTYGWYWCFFFISVVHMVPFLLVTMRLPLNKARSR